MYSVIYQLRRMTVHLMFTRIYGISSWQTVCLKVRLSSYTMLKEVKNMGKSSACFLIGSSFGISQKVKDKADFKLSMGKMTFPHHLARIMVLEQIYRAEAIQAGSKYHK